MGRFASYQGTPTYGVGANEEDGGVRQGGRR
jgi:hypothetical protein